MAGIAAAAILAYSRTFQVPFLYDDIPSIVNNPTLQHLGPALWPPADSTVSGRPVLNLSLALNFAASGTSVWSYHAANLAIHVLAALVLFGTVRRTLVPRTVLAAAVAFSVSLVWVLHPLQTESVTYVIQRAESLMGLLYLLTLYCFIRGAGAAGAARILWFSLSCAACFLGMATKEVMISAPLVVLLYDRTFLSGSFPKSLRARPWVYAGLASSWSVLLVLVLSTHGRSGTAGFDSGVSWSSYGATEMPAIVHYLVLSVWPGRLVFDYGTALVPLSPATVAYLVAFSVLAAAVVWALFKRPVLGFLGFCFVVILAPSSSVFPVASEPIAEHRMYLALIPVAILVVAGMYRWLGRAALPCSLAVAAALFATTFRRNEVFRTEEGIWGDTVAKRPGNERAHNNLGDALDSEGRIPEAIAQFREVIRLKPDYAEAHSNLGNALAKLPGRLAEAASELELALRLKPDFAKAHNNLGSVFAKTPGRLEAAVVQFEDALRLRPDYADAENNLGNALVAEGRFAAAIGPLEAALRLNPDSAEAHSNLGNCLARLPGRLDEAIAQYGEALRLRPGYANAHNNLGSALAREGGRLNEAVAQFQEAIRLRPDYADAHCNLGMAFGSEGRMAAAAAEFQEALRLQPDNALAARMLAGVSRIGP